MWMDKYELEEIYRKLKAIKADCVINSRIHKIATEIEEKLVILELKQE